MYLPEDRVKKIISEVGSVVIELANLGFDTNKKNILMSLKDRKNTVSNDLHKSIINDAMLVLSQNT